MHLVLRKKDRNFDKNVQKGFGHFIKNIFDGNYVNITIQNKKEGGLIFYNS